jgi:predicted Zn finger-like uncharacterized protein
MIASCPKCSARYRIERDRLRPEGVRLRCRSCSAVFRVLPPAGEMPVEPSVAAELTQPPQPPAAAPPACVPASEAAPAPAAAFDVVSPEPPPQPGVRPPVAQGRALVADADGDRAKSLCEALVRLGFETHAAHDGVEAILEIQRKLPRLVVLDAALPRMYGFQICELMKRNESLRSIRVVLFAAIEGNARYRRDPTDLYGADAYLEPADLPDGLARVLDEMGFGGAAPGAGEPAAASPVASSPPAAGPAEQGPAPPLAFDAIPDDGLGDERAKAARLARIVVSDIILYNDAKFDAAVREGAVAERMDGDLEEGRALFRARIDARVRDERDWLVDELLRVAELRRARS